jgi:GH24 family phage-related lysozyme (muramidase)
MSGTRSTVPTAGLAALALLGGLAVAAPVHAASNPYTPQRVCGAGFTETVAVRDLGGKAKLYLMHSPTARANCAVTIKTTKVGTRSSTETWLMVNSGTWMHDKGDYEFYAGPVKGASTASCAYAGGHDGVNWTSPMVGCARAHVPPVTKPETEGAVKDGSVWNVSEAGISFLARQEGFGNNGKRYADPSGWCTVGYGHLLLPKRTCTADDRRAPAMTQAEALSLLRQDLRTRFIPATRNLTKGTALTQNKFDALVSMVFNLGAEEIRTYHGKPSAFITTLRSGDHRQIPRLMENFSQERGTFSCGLNKRRIREGIIFSGGSYTAVVSACRPR